MTGEVGKFTALRRSCIPQELPKHRHLLPSLCLFAVIKYTAVLQPEFVHQPGGLHVVATILGDLGQLSLLPPLQRLHPVRRLATAERLLTDRVEPHPRPDDLLHVLHQVEHRHLAQIENRIGCQHLEIESNHVVTHHPVRALQFLQQLVDILLPINLVGAALRAVGHAQRQFHRLLVVPATHLRGAFLGLQVEIDKVGAAHGVENHAAG
jgi:hypothetical protein